ncbi:MAG: aminotransferase class I/II-fold pyridoxal phosphate-dependent enzyme [Actinomycetota bacterium]|nr:aminotransferase class I/II-fold pyridoxal phosphate-dependent enzyme [Actinomycetota bacterium]
MNQLAVELNEKIKAFCPALFAVLSELGRELYFPKGILTQTAEAREKAHRFNATIGIAKSGGQAMYLPVVMEQIPGLSSDEALDYAPATGNLMLRREWHKQMLEKNPSLEGKKTSLPIVTAGITHGLSISADLFVDPGDTVIIPDKFWGNYQMIFGTRKKAEIEKFRFFSDDNGFDVASFASTLSKVLQEKGKAIVVLNFPNNPTGYSIKKDEAQALVDTIVQASDKDRRIVVLLDDAYFGLFYDDDVLPESLFGLLAGQSENLISVKLDGATKEHYVWGFRVGFITFNVAAGKNEEEVYGAIEKKVGGAIRGNISNCPLISQSIILKALSNPDISRQKLDKLEIMRSRAKRIREVLENPKFAEFMEPYPFNSGYFMCLKLKGVDAEEFRKKLLRDYGVGVIADGSDIRVAFSCLEEKEIEEVFDTMYECLHKWGQVLQ